jgi:acyl-CoA thioester hydrolase
MSETFVHRLRVRYGECDPQGVVFNANYFAYFDVVLTEFWRHAIGPYGAMIDQGADLVVGEAKARFLAPAIFDDEIDCELKITRLGTTAMTTQIDIRRDGEVLVEGELRHVFIDPATKQKRQMPEEIRGGLAPYAVDDADLREPAV